MSSIAVFLDRSSPTGKGDRKHDLCYVSYMTPVREGDLLAGKYRIERVLGSGGMGVVFAARHEELGQLVAIKLVREDVLGNADAIERFLREARSAVRLKSEHVARVIDVGKLDSGAPYMVMEFLDGDDLGHVLEERGALPIDAAVQLVLQACEAVAEAHAAGIVHRDLKPQNLFLTRSVTGFPRLKVLDFGVSKTAGITSDRQGALTRTRSMLGSPLYMSPEQMRSAKDVDARADVWALGVVLFELVTRRWPFEADNMPQLCLKVVGEPPQSLAALRPDAPPGLVAVVERCLDKDRGGRYANAAELSVALEPFGPEQRPRRSPSAAFFARPEEALAALPGHTDAGHQVSQVPANVSAAPAMPGQMSSAPAAWDSTSRRSGAPTLGVRFFLWVGAAAGVFAILAWVGLARRSSAPRVAAASASTSVPVPPLPLAPVALAPAPVALAPAPAASTLSAGPALLAKVEALPSPAPVAIVTAVRPRQAAPARSAKPDDDIPSFR